MPEKGSAIIDYLLDEVPRSRLRCLTLGALEAVSIIIRSKNAGRIGVTDADDAIRAVRLEAFGSIPTIPATDDLVLLAVSLIEDHHVNSTDAVLLRAALDLRAAMRRAGDDLVLVCSDHRLLRAARREGLPALDPEDEDHQALQALAEG